MTKSNEALLDKALIVQRHLKEQGALEDALVVEQLIAELADKRSKSIRPYYTVTETAELIGISGQTVKNWVNRGMLKGYRLGNRVVIPRAELDNYRSMAESLKSLDPLPSTEEIVDSIRQGRRHFVWPIQGSEPDK